MAVGSGWKITPLWALRLAIICCALASASGTLQAQDAKPNILMITCHDLGQHLGCYGVKTVASPNIDALARRGVRVANYFAAAPTCSPSRGVMLTGRYPQSNGLMGLTHAPWWWKFNRGERHLAAILADAGYATTLIGLTHVGKAEDLGYQQVLSPKRVASQSVQAACKFLRGAKGGGGGKPFFVKVGFFEVHRAAGGYKHRKPDMAKGVYIPPHLKDTPEIRDDLARFQGDIRVTDGYVGQILQALSASTVADNTIVIFTADHGIAYAGAKWSLREAGLRIPLILHKPGSPLTGGKVFEQLMSNVDFLPTLLDLCGVAIPANVQGLSFRKVIEGKAKQGPRKHVFAQRISHALRDNTSRSVRDSRWKLIRYFREGRAVVYPTGVEPIGVSRHITRPQRAGGSRPFVQLFDLENDPHELTDVGGKSENGKIVRALQRRLHKWMKSVDDPILKGPIATPYYQRSMAAFRDAVKE